jgi:hypothetical protein
MANRLVALALILAVILTGMWFAHQSFKMRHWKEFKAAGDRAFGRKNYLYAEKMYREALQIAEDQDERDPRVVKSLTALHRLHKAQGSTRLADSLLVRAHTIDQSRKR